MSAIWGCCSAPVIGNSGAFMDWLGQQLVTKLPLLSFPILPPLPWLACRSMRSQVLSYPSPTPWLACRSKRSQVLHYPFPSFPHSPGLLIGLWGARSFPILPPPPWLACRSMRSQVLYYPFSSFPHSPGLLVGLWGARSFTILSHPSPTPLACL